MAQGDNDSDSDSSEGSSRKGSAARSSPPRRSRASPRRHRPQFKRNSTPRSRFSAMPSEELANHQREFQRRILPLQPEMPPPPPLLPQAGAAGAALGPDPGLLLPVLIEQRLTLQQVEIQRLLHDNQQLAASHLSLRQELSAAHEQLLQRREGAQMDGEKDEHIRVLADRVSKQEVDLRGMKSLKDDLEKLMLQRQELSARLQQETLRAQADSLQVASLKAHVEGLQKELQLARISLEQERKASAEHLLHRQAMERSYHSVLEEVGRLRIELAEMNAHKAYAGPKSSPVYGSLPQDSFVNGNPMQQDVNKYPNDTNSNFTSAGLPNGQQMPPGQEEVVANDPPPSARNEWTVHMAPNGKYFYHNNITGMTQWDKPTAMVAQEQSHMQPFQEEKLPHFGHFSTSQQAVHGPIQPCWPAENGGNVMNAPYAQALEPPGGQMAYAGLPGQAIMYPGQMPLQIATQSPLQHGHGQMSHAASSGQAVAYPGQMPPQIANQSSLQHWHGMPHGPQRFSEGQMSNAMSPGQTVVYPGQIPPQIATPSPLQLGQGNGTPP